MIRLSGSVKLCHQVGAFASITLAGVLYDKTGSYLIPFAGALLLPASISAFTINEKKYSIRYQGDDLQPKPHLKRTQYKEPKGPKSSALFLI